ASSQPAWWLSALWFCHWRPGFPAPAETGRVPASEPARTTGTILAPPRKHAGCLRYRQAAPFPPLAGCAAIARRWAGVLGCRDPPQNSGETPPARPLATLPMAAHGDLT